MVKIEKSFVENMFSVEGKVAIVTGATGALGCVLAKAYCYAGAKVVMTGRNESKLAALDEEFKAEGLDCAYVVADPSSVEDVQNLVAKTVEIYGEINILAVCHGVNNVKPMLEQTVEEWQAVMDADCKSVYIVIKYVAEQMVKQVKAIYGDDLKYQPPGPGVVNKVPSGQGGKIVVVTSQRSKRGMYGYTGYCTSKGGADMMVATLACELSAPYGINVNSLLPTVFRSAVTEWMYDPDSAVYINFMKREPIGRLAEADDFAGYALFLSSNASNFITGANCDCSGGYLQC